nr:MATE family efflux transporter [Aquicoccus sp. G2-2]MEA1113738.1 MATE family efflux transporter [Aquicoccus sp. G2-2]
MTLTSAMGLSFMFLVDFLALWWVSRLHSEILITALGFAATMQFFLVSIAIGMTIGAVALVSQTLGQGRPQRARRIATTALILSVGAESCVAALAYVFRYDLLRLSGASGEALHEAAGFLAIALPSLPLSAAGMTGSAILRARGDAWRSMAVTSSAGLVAVFLDPLLIVVLGWGIEGAATVIVISRGVMALVALYWLTGVHKMLTKPSLADMRLYIGGYLAIALPAIATQVSTPFGNWVLIRAMAEHGDSAVAGMGVVGRVMILAFGGIFALSGAIGGIIGQNAGAGLRHRVQSAYLDALKFCAIYTGVVWVLLASLGGTIAQAFGLSGQGQYIVEVFCTYSAGSFVFTGALFVANSAFNNLGRPFWATLTNWTRDGVLIGVLAFAMGALWGETGVVLAQAVANVLAGIGAGWIGWLLVKRGAGLAAGKP